MRKSKSKIQKRGREKVTGIASAPRDVELGLGGEIACANVFRKAETIHRGGNEVLIQMHNAGSPHERDNQDQDRWRVCLHEESGRHYYYNQRWVGSYSSQSPFYSFASLSLRSTE